MLKKVIYVCIFSTILFAKPIDLECALSKTKFDNAHKDPLHFLMYFTIDSDKKTVSAEGMFADIYKANFSPSNITIISNLKLFEDSTDFSSSTLYTKVWIERNTLKITTINGVLKSEVGRLDDTKWSEAIGTCKIRSIKNKI